MTTFNHTPGQPPQSDFPYFSSLRKSILTALFVAAFTPMLFIGGGMYYYYAAIALKTKTVELLRSDVQHHQKTVDQFLAERVMDLRQVCGTMDVASLTRAGGLEVVLQSLHTGGAWFTDLGVIDQDGRHLAYTGPHDLIAKNYKNAAWFKAVINRDVYISNVFSGLRQEPHFIIAVKQKNEGGVFILRATMNAAFFDELVVDITAKSGGESFLVDPHGVFQTTPPGGGKLMEPSGINPPERFDGIKMEELNGQISVMIWLTHVPWLSVVQLQKKVIFDMLYSVRNVGLFVLILGIVLTSVTVLWTTNHLVRRLEINRKHINLMDQHLRQANKMTLSLQLYSGFFQEIGETFANINSTAAWIGVQNRETAYEKSARNEIDGSLAQIQEETRRGHKTIQEVIRFSLPSDPLVANININSMLEDLVKLFRRELHFNNIRIVRNYQKKLPLFRNDPAQVRQVLQNLIFNALSAVERGGKITLTTQHLDDRIRVTVADNGPGVPEEMAEKVFEPLFTSNPKRLGLGLSICRSILEKMGGAIAIESTPEKGAAFSVDFPFRLIK